MHFTVQYLCLQIQGGVLVFVSALLEEDLAPDQLATAVCGDSQPKDHTR